MLVPSGKNLVILNGSCGWGKERKKKERKKGKSHILT
jgi:hypothetical protein